MQAVSTLFRFVLWFLLGLAQWHGLLEGVAYFIQALVDEDPIALSGRLGGAGRPIAEVPLALPPSELPGRPSPIEVSGLAGGRPNVDVLLAAPPDDSGFLSPIELSGLVGGGRPINEVPLNSSSSGSARPFVVFLLDDLLLSLSLSLSLDDFLDFLVLV